MPSTSYPGLGWPGIAACQRARTLTQGGRRSVEMAWAATLDARWLKGKLVAAIAAVQRAQGATGAAGADLSRTIAATLATRTEKARHICATSPSTASLIGPG